MSAQFQITPTDPANLVSEITELKKSLSYLHDHVRAQDKKLSQCLKNEKDTSSLILKLQRDHSDLVKYTYFLEEYCLDLDTKSRKKHLVLTGIAETPEENKPKRVPFSGEENENEMETDESAYNPTIGVALTVLQSIHETLIYDDIDVAYRVGRKGLGPRPILIKFVKEHVRNEVNKKRIHLKDSDDTKQSFLNEDLPIKINQQRSELRCIVDHAKSKNVNAKVLGNRILVANKTYTHRDIDKLPQGLKISDAKTIDTPKGIAFQSQYSFLSNLYPAQTKYNGINYPSAEHAYQHSRALFLGKHDCAHKIRIAKSGMDAKREASNLPSTKEWDSCKVNSMRDIVYAKFAQNAALQTKLLETGDRALLEATYDSFWGCGLTLSARKMKQGDWHGKNHLGQILVDCRTEIRRERAASGLSTGHQDPASMTQSQQVIQQQPPTQSLRQKTMNARQTSKSNIHKSPAQFPTQSQMSQFYNQSQQLISPADQQQQVGNSHQIGQPNCQQMPMWPNQTMYPPPGYQYPNQMPPVCMYPQFLPAPSQPNNQLGSFQSSQMYGNHSWPPPTNHNLGIPKQASPVSTISDYFAQGERRFSYDACLSPEIHV